jgi:predicted DNA-binding transcriptional regulator AlpA
VNKPFADFRAAHLTPRRGLRREEAALYVGVSPTKFDELVRDGRMPKPKRIDGCVVWDVRRLDMAWDALDGDDVEPDSFADFE